MARVVGVDIPNNKRLEIALTYIFGVGRTTSLKVCKELGLDPGMKARDLTEEQLAEHFCTTYNNAWGGHHGFAKMPLKQAQRTVKALKPVMDPDIIFFVLDGDKPVAFYVNIPELNQIFRHVNGNLNAIGKLKFLYHKWRKTSDIMVGLVFGIDLSLIHI